MQYLAYELLLTLCLLPIWSRATAISSSVPPTGLYPNSTGHLSSAENIRPAASGRYEPSSGAPRRNETSISGDLISTSLSPPFQNISGVTTQPSINAATFSITPAASLGVAALDGSDDSEESALPTPGPSAHPLHGANATSPEKQHFPQSPHATQPYSHSQQANRTFYEASRAHDTFRRPIAPVNVTINRVTVATTRSSSGVSFNATYNSLAGIHTAKMSRGNATSVSPVTASSPIKSTATESKYLMDPYRPSAPTNASTVTSRSNHVTLHSHMPSPPARHDNAGMATPSAVVGDNFNDLASKAKASASGDLHSRLNSSTITATPNPSTIASACPQYFDSTLKEAYTVPAKGSGWDYAVSCDHEWRTWWGVSAAWSQGLVYNPRITSTMTVANSEAPGDKTIKTVETSRPANATITGYKTKWSEVLSGYGAPPTTTLCDGYPRAPGTWTIAGTTKVTSLVPEYDRTPEDRKNYLQPACAEALGQSKLPKFELEKPKCSIKPQDCASLWEAFLAPTPTAWRSQFSANVGPVCHHAGSKFLSDFTDPNPNNCHVSGSQVRLYFWPASTTSSNLCDPSPAASITPAPAVPQLLANATSPNDNPSTVIDGITVQSPYAYLSIDALYGIWPGPFRAIPDVTSQWSNVGVTVHPSELSSIIRTIPNQPWQTVVSHAINKHVPAAYWTTLNERYDVAKLQGPINARDYFLALTKNPPAAYPGAHYPGISTIYQDFYHPFLSIPSAVSETLPAISTCSFALRGLYDPPQAITAEGGFNAGPPQAPVQQLSGDAGNSIQPGIPSPPAPTKDGGPIAQPQNLPPSPASALAAPTAAPTNAAVPGSPVGAGQLGGSDPGNSQPSADSASGPEDAASGGGAPLGAIAQPEQAESVAGATLPQEGQVAQGGVGPEASMAVVQALDNWQNGQEQGPGSLAAALPANGPAAPVAAAVVPFGSSSVLASAVTGPGQQGQPAVVFGSQTMQIGQVLTTGGSVVSVGPAGALNVDGSTVNLAAPAATMLGQSNEEPVAHVAAGSTTLNIPFARISATLSGVKDAARPLNNDINLSAGGPATTFDGQVISAAFNGAVVVDRQKSYIATAPAQSSEQASQLATLESSIAALSLQPGGPAITIDSHTITRASNGDYYIDGTQTSISTAAAPTANLPLQQAISSLSLQPGGPPQTIGSHTLSLAPNGAYIIDGMTVAHGYPNNPKQAAAFIDSALARLSLKPGDTPVVISASPTAHPDYLSQQQGDASSATPTPTPTAPPHLPSAVSSLLSLLSIGTDITDTSSAFALSGALGNLSPGGTAATVNGHVLSLASDEGIVVDDSATIPAPAALPTDVGGIAVSMDGEGELLVLSDVPMTGGGGGVGEGTATFGPSALTAATTDVSAAASLLGALHLTGGGAVTVGGEVVSVGVDGGLFVDGRRVVENTTTAVSGVGTEATGAFDVVPTSAGSAGAVHEEGGKKKSAAGRLGLEVWVCGVGVVVGMMGVVGL